MKRPTLPPPRNKLAAALLMAALDIFLVVGWAVDVQAIYIRDEVSVADYNALALRLQYQATGYFRIRNAGSSNCSGTLVTSTVFLTAAHSVDPDADLIPNLPATSWVIGFDVNLPGGKLPADNNVAGFSINPGRAGGGTFLHDMVIVYLAGNAWAGSLDGACETSCQREARSATLETSEVIRD